MLVICRPVSYKESYNEVQHINLNFVNVCLSYFILNVLKHQQSAGGTNTVLKLMVNSCPLAGRRAASAGGPAHRRGARPAGRW